MLFSILIPTYNNGKSIEKAVRSALNQDYSGEYEVVVVNNASTDNTADVLSQIKDEHLKLFTNPQTVNIYANHNVALSYAKGDYVVYCHGDDELLPHTLKVMASYVEKHLYPTQYILFGHSRFRDFSEWFPKEDALLTYNCMFSGWTAKRIFMDGGLSPSGVLYSRQALINIGGFDATDGAYESDWLVFLKAAFEGFEFEFSDRMLFKREYATTYVASNQDKIAKERILSQQRFIDGLSASQLEDLQNIYWSYGCHLWDYFYAPHIPTKQERLDGIMSRYRKQPWKIWKLAKWMKVKWCE